MSSAYDLALPFREPGATQYGDRMPFGRLPLAEGVRQAVSDLLAQRQQPSRVSVDRFEQCLETILERLHIYTMPSRPPGQDPLSALTNKLGGGLYPGLVHTELFSDHTPVADISDHLLALRGRKLRFRLAARPRGLYGETAPFNHEMGLVVALAAGSSDQDLVPAFQQFVSADPWRALQVLEEGVVAASPSGLEHIQFGSRIPPSALLVPLGHADPDLRAEALRVLGRFQSLSSEDVSPPRSTPSSRSP